MVISTIRSIHPPLLCFLAGILIIQSLSAVETTQSISLQTGWNAVWLEVDPVHTSGNLSGTGKPPTDVFTDAAIQVVATPNASLGTPEFLSDPTDGVIYQKGWQVWHRASELGNNTLGVVRGYRGYLIKSSSAITLSITGTARYHEIDWEPFSYNLVGFGLQGSTTFGQLLGGSSKAHPLSKVYQLNPANGAWEGVQATTAMQSGRAYWIYCEGNQGFNGPINVAFPGVYGIDFADDAGAVSIPDPQNNAQTLSVNLRELTLTNTSSGVQRVRLTKVLPNSGASSLSDPLRIFDVVPTPGTLDYRPGAGLLNTTDFILSSQTTETVTLGANRNWTSGAARRENLYRIEFEHHYRYLPMAAENPSLTDAVLGTADPAAAGLWVGEVVLDRVTSLTEAGRPIKPATSKAPIRVILHVDGQGNTNLLSHVMVMQTKTADPTVVPSEVLLVNEEKIPFYEGIEERAGKRVGLRIESVGYDMPRTYFPNAQESLRTQVATDLSVVPASLTSNQLQTWVSQRSTRPPALAETYQHRFPMAGSIGPNKALRTAEPFTDSNNDGLFGEPFTDADSNGRYDGARTEVLNDLNNNGIHDATSETFTDTDGNNVWNVLIPGEPFVDSNNNGIIDGDPFIDTNGDGIWTENLDSSKDLYYIDSNGNRALDPDTETPLNYYQFLATNGFGNAATLLNQATLDALHTIGSTWCWVDNDGNGILDPGRYEPFHNRVGTTAKDPGEAFTDTNGNGLYDAAVIEPFVDANGDGKYTLAETFTDLNQNGVFDGNIPAEPFVDSDNNNVYTPEPFTDLNGNGVWDGAYLTLDPFHRSNPFRHAFHPQHGTGKALSRAITIEFDSKGTSSLLHGNYSETVAGLTAAPITFEGKISLERISTTASLVQ